MVGFRGRHYATATDVNDVRRRCFLVRRPVSSPLYCAWQCRGAWESFPRKLSFLSPALWTTVVASAMSGRRR